MSQVLSLTQYNHFRNTLVSNMGVPNLLLAPGAIQPCYAPDHMLKTSMQVSKFSNLFHTLHHVSVTEL